MNSFLHYYCFRLIDRCFVRKTLSFKLQSTLIVAFVPFWNVSSIASWCFMAGSGNVPDSEMKRTIASLFVLVKTRLLSPATWFILTVDALKHHLVYIQIYMKNCICTLLITECWHYKAMCRLLLNQASVLHCFWVIRLRRLRENTSVHHWS